MSDGGAFATVVLTEVATGLRFPEGPIAMPDGTVILVEMFGPRITRVHPDGRTETVAEIVGGRQGERCRFHRFESGEDSGDLVVGASQRSQQQHLVVAVGQHHPFTAACTDECSDRVAHGLPAPKTSGRSATTADQSSS